MRPSFGNYGFGTAVTFNLNRFIGIEGEVGAMIATTSDLQFGDLPSDIKAPNMLNYTANVVVSPWTGHSFVPYAAGGVGGLTMFERPALGDHERRDVSERQRRRRREVVCAEQPLGTARRLSLRRDEVEGRCARVLRPRDPIRAPRLRRRRHQHSALGRRQPTAIVADWPN